MKWGSKKEKPPPSTLPSSSSRPSLISHVFPISWLSRFKQKSGNSEPKPSKFKPKGKRNSPSMGSPRCASSGGGRFYGLDDDDDDGFWRLSFGEDSAEGKKKNGGAVRSVRYDSDDEFEVRPSSCRNCQTSATKMEAREGSQNTKDMHKSGNAKDWKLRKEDGGVSGKKWLELEREAEEAEERSTEREYRAVLEMLAARTDWTTERDKHRLNASDTRKHHHVSSFYSRNSGLKTIEEEVLNLETEEVSAEKRTPDWQKLKERKIEELKSKSEKHRKSLYISRELQRRKTKRSNKVRVCSPRTASRVEICKIKALQDMTKAKVRVCSPRTASRVEICKIKALQDLTKAKLKTKKLTKEERTVQQIRTGLDSFAVVKCSFDPHQDFRDSMVEMIEEKKITQPEDLEELLACYLTLNSDEYHDLIIKVFRQVWFDLNKTCFGTEIHSEQGCND